MAGPRIHLESRAIAFGYRDRVVRVARRVAPVVFALYLAGLLVCAEAGGDAAATPILVAGLVLAPLAVLVLALDGAMRGRTKAGSITADSHALTIRRGLAERTLPLSELAHGCTVHPDGVSLQTRRGVEVFAKLPAAEAEALLDVTGLSAAARVARFPLASAASRRRGMSILVGVGVSALVPIALFAMVLCVLVLYEVIHAWVAWGKAPLDDLPAWLIAQLPIAVVASIGAVVLGRYLRRQEVLVGTDGIVVLEPFRRRTIPHDTILGVERHAWGVLLRLAGGRSQLLPVRARPLGPLPEGDAPTGDPGVDADLEHRATLLRRIEEARSVGGSSAGARVLDVLDRRGRSSGAWLAELRALLRRDPDYRSAAVLRDELADVAADPRAHAERRVAAMVALSRVNDVETRRRVRLAVDACADMELRAALEEAAEGEIAPRYLK
jgi:hypothetical protein